MAYQTKTLATAFGALLALLPIQSYSQPYAESVSQRINKYWLKTGDYLGKSLDKRRNNDSG